MKKIIMFMLCAACAAFHAEDKTEEKIVQFSWIEWDSIKKTVDTNGYCRIANQNVAIVITNGLPEVEHLFPLVQDRLERNPLRLKGKCGKKDSYKPGSEPMPYIGQGGW